MLEIIDSGSVDLIFDNRGGILIFIIRDSNCKIPNLALTVFLSKMDGMALHNYTKAKNNFCKMKKENMFNSQCIVFFTLPQKVRHLERYSHSLS